MKITIRQSNDWDSAMAIHLMSMPSDEFDRSDHTKLWIAWADDQPVGYATLTVWDSGCVFLAGCAVIPIARGKGLQKRLIRTRETWCKRQKIKHMITYTVPENPPSINNLISTGFRVYNPQYAWVGRTGVLYWYKKIK